METEKLREIAEFLDRELSNTDKNLLPDIQVGIYRGAISPTKIKELKNLPQATTVKLENMFPEESDDVSGIAPFYLFIRNQGIGVAKFIKVHLELLGYANTKGLPRSVEISELSRGWVRRDARNFVFSGGSEWVLYPQDNASFGFYLEMDTDLSRQLSFECTVWAEGLREAVKANLEVWPG